MSDKVTLLHEFTEEIAEAIIKYNKLGLKADDFIFVFNFIIVDKLEHKSKLKQLVEEKFTSANSG